MSSRISLTTRFAVGCGGVLAALIAGAGVASAAPDVNAIANSTCTYPQVMAALNAQSPDVASRFTASPVATAWLQQLVASTPDQRQVMIAQVQKMPAMQQYGGLISQVASTCSNY